MKRTSEKEGEDDIDKSMKKERQANDEGEGKEDEKMTDDEEYYEVNFNNNNK